MLARLGKRLLHTSRPISKNITTRAEITQLLNTPTWSIKHYFRNVPRTSPISTEAAREIFEKMMKLSGLNPLQSYSDPKSQQLIQSLKLQMMFIRHLYEDDCAAEDDIDRDDRDDAPDEVGASESQLSNGGKGVGNDVDDDMMRSEGGGNDVVFRLIASDHLPPAPLSLAQLLAMVDAVGEGVDAEKGEIGFCLDDLKR
ncbi:uncharacterized protein LODBEIA_P54900 [Lodderomyces beijingensis]|uniref:Uncharacterized protein n=1 Tax=Lodderomyces beijingensis TaxID=1775926 RepID=A0ABP0ZVN0_9ASCO